MKIIKMQVADVWVGRRSNCQHKSMEIQRNLSMKNIHSIQIFFVFSEDYIESHLLHMRSKYNK